MPAEARIGGGPSLSDELAEGIHHWLFSTPTRLVGQLETDRLKLQLAWPSLDAMRSDAFSLPMQEGPLAQQRLLLSVDFGGRPDQPDFALPKLRLVDGQAQVQAHVLPRRVASLVSLWFGKLVELDGELDLGSIVQVPALSPPAPLMSYALPPYNHRSRPELGGELNLESMQAALKLLFVEEPQSAVESVGLATHWRWPPLPAPGTQPR